MESLPASTDNDQRLPAADYKVSGPTPYYVIDKAESSFFRNVTEAGLEKIAAGCSHLATLGLTWCQNVTDAGLENIAAGCPHLVSLNLSYCHNVTGAGKALFPTIFPA